MLETRLLRYFLAVARELNITKAADSLFISQSTLSKQMMNLEEQIGKPLYHRGGKQLTLTEEGKYLKDRAQEIMTLIDSTESNLLSNETTVAGDIRIGCGETVAMNELIHVFSQVQSKHPDIKIHTHSGDANAVTEMLDKGLVDMGLLIGPYKEDRYQYLNLHRHDTYGLLVPNDSELASQNSIHIEQLKELPLIISNQVFTGNQAFRDLGLNYETLNIRATYNLIYNAIFMVEQKMGYVLSLDNLVNTNGRNITFVPIEPALSLDIFLVTKKYQTFSPAMNIFIDFIEQYYQKSE